MRTVMVRYKTKEGQAATNEALIHAVFDELRSREPGGLNYASYRLADGATFVHIAMLDGTGENRKSPWSPSSLASTPTALGGEPWRSSERRR
jgi:hypothetical protein